MNNESEMIDVVMPNGEKWNIPSHKFEEAQKRGAQKLPRETSSNHSELAKYLGDIPYALAKTGRGVANAILPKSLENKQPVEDVFPHGEGLGHSLVQGAAGFAPFAAVAPELAGLRGAGMLGKGLAHLGENAIPGAAYGASEAGSEGQPIGEGAAIGAGANTVAGAIPKLARVGFDKVKDALTKYAGKGLTTRIGDFMANPNRMDNQEAHQLAKSELNKVSGEEKKSWEKLDQAANTADEKAKEIVPGYKTATFDTKEYIASLKDKLQELRKQSKAESGFELRNKPAIRLLEGILEKPEPRSFKDAVAHAQSLNEHFSREMEPGEGIPFDTINYAIGQFNKSVDKNIEQKGLKGTLGDAWNEAKSITKEKHQTFNETPNAAGDITESRFKKGLSETNPQLDKGTFIKDYLPRKNENSVGRMENLSKMLGDNQAAKDLINKNYFADSFKNKELDPTSFINKYQSLDKANKDYLFPKDKQATIEALSTIIRNHPEMLKNDTRNIVQKHSLSAMLGALVGLTVGHPDVGIVSGVALQNLAHKGLSSALSHPKLSERAAERLTRSRPKVNPSKETIKRLISQSTLTPAITRYLGGQ